MISSPEPGRRQLAAAAAAAAAGEEALGEAVFTYGSLEFDDVMEAVTGRRFEARAAVLEGHSRRLLQGRVYPAIVPHDHERTDGTLYPAIDSSSLTLLDAFESDLYTRLMVRVTTADGREYSAWAWVLQPGFAELLSIAEWDRESFLREHHARFLEACHRFRRERVWTEPS
jgi:gamma-glutamylcyclotransferase (GGCT)/AIG2-like uncharacterized protein YtfP